MDIYPSDYRKVTDKLQVGSVHKVPHIGCSSSSCLRIQNTIEGFKFYCFKCGSYEFSSNFNSPAERLRRTKIMEEQTRLQADKDYSLPADFSHTISSRGLAWLGKGGWTTELIQKYNIGFSETLNRVILPVVYNCIQVGYTARAVESWQQPKYLEMCKPGAIWESSCTHLVMRSSCVVCEDILSAGRCGEFIQAYALLGTSLDTPQLGALTKYRQIYLWLDNDRGGRSGLKSMVNRLSILATVQIITSDVDPKLLTSKEIKERLHVQY